MILPSISLSLLLSKRFNTGRAVLTISNGGGGFLLRHKFDNVQTILRVNVTYNNKFNNNLIVVVLYLY